MKLATLRDGARDGRLVVVSRDVTRCSDARHIAPSLQAALDGWERLAPHLDLVARGVETGGQPVARFHERGAAAPLPRAYGFARAASPGGPVRQAPADGFLGPRDPARIDAERGVAVEAGAAVVLGDLPRGADRAAALAAVRLVMLCCAVGEEGAEAAFAFSPVAVTPDELGAAWEGGRLGGALLVERNGTALGRFAPEAALDFGALIVEAARRRAIGAGAILGAAAVFRGEAAPGDRLRVEMRDARGHGIFGAIEQRVERRVEPGAAA